MTRIGALLPDIIHIGNHVIIYRMSREEFESKCKSLKAKCTNTNKLGKDSNAHISKHNLEKMTNNLSSILKLSEKITKDWENKKF